MTIIVTKLPEENKVQKYQFKDTIGYLPSKMANKSYMQAYHNHYQYQVIGDETMGWGIKIKAPKFISKAFKDVGNFISKAAKDVAKIAAPVVVAIQGVGEFTENVYDATKKVALSVLPPDIRKFVSDTIISLEKVVTNPVATVKAITETTSEIATNIYRESSKAATVVYREVVRPSFNIARNIANETVWKPVNKVVDVAVLPVLPKSIRDKVDSILDVPDAAFRGKLTDKDVVAGVKAAVQLGVIPMRTMASFQGAVINTLRKDAILGPFLSGFDKYTGGLLTSAENLNKMPDDIYRDRSIDWKARIIDALKIYLAATSAGAIARGIAATYVGEQTGLDQTVVGRTVLSAGVGYASALNYGSMTALVDSVSLDAAKTATTNAIVNQTRSLAVTEAVKKGYVDSAFTAKMILSAGGKFYNAAGTDQTLMDTMKEVHDAEFQNLVDYQIKKETGLPVTYAHLVDIYNTDWSRLADDVSRELSKIPTSISVSTGDGQFLAKLGQNMIDEMKRLPNNFQNISANVYNELARTPENLAKFASAVSNEAVRTPENIAKIANNIATESAIAAENAAREAARAAANVAAEAARTPENVVNIASNVGTEVVKGASNMVNEAKKVDWDKLIQKYGPQIVPFLQGKYPGFTPDMALSDDMINDIELNYIPTQKPKFSRGLLAGGLIAALATAYVATKD